MYCSYSLIKAWLPKGSPGLPRVLLKPREPRCPNEEEEKKKAQKIQTLRDLTYLFPRKLHERKINHSCFRSYHTEGTEGVDRGHKPKAASGGEWAAGAGARKRLRGQGPGGQRGACPRGTAAGGGARARGWEGGGGGNGRDGGGRALTRAVGLALEDVQLRAVGQRVLQAELEEAGLGLAHALEQRQQRNSLLALIPALKPTRQHPDLVAKHHG